MNDKDATKKQCQGACEEHVGEVREVFVQGWGYFDYCETAIAEDRKRGLIVIEEKGKHESTN